LRAYRGDAAGAGTSSALALARERVGDDATAMTASTSSKTSISHCLFSDDIVATYDPSLSARNLSRRHG